MEEAVEVKEQAMFKGEDSSPRSLRRRARHYV
jgi:hypothetical protein